MNKKQNIASIELISFVEYGKEERNIENKRSVNWSDNEINETSRKKKY